MTRELTSVSGVRTNLYFCKISMRAILASMRANLIPMQLRGPQPKGMWQRAGRFAFSSGVNLRKREKDGGRMREEEMKGRSGRREEKWLPFWIKFLRFWPDFWIVVDEADRELDIYSLGNGDSVDLDGLLSNSWGTATNAIQGPCIYRSGHFPVRKLMAITLLHRACMLTMEESQLLVLLAFLNTIWYKYDARESSISYLILIWRLDARESSEEKGRNGSITVVLLGTAGVSPESPCPGIAVLGWQCIWRHPVRRWRRWRKEEGRWERQIF